MSPNCTSIDGLPAELLLRILSFFVPSPTGMRTLRHVLKACHRTDHKNLHAAAEKVLQDQRAWLLDRWHKIHAKTHVPDGVPPGIEAIAEQVIGKQCLSPKSVADAVDYWTIKKSDLAHAKIRVCKLLGDHYHPALNAETPDNSTYLYDDDPGRRGGGLIRMVEYDHYLDPTRLNLEVSSFEEDTFCSATVPGAVDGINVDHYRYWPLYRMA